MKLIGFNVWILLRYCGKTLVPERHGEKYAIGFRCRGDVALTSPGQFECVSNNTVATSPCKDALLDRHLEGAIAIQPSSRLRIFPFGIFTYDYEINVAMLAPTERAADSLQQASVNFKKEKVTGVKGHC